MDNGKTNGEGQICARQRSSVESTSTDREVNVATSTSNTPAITAATETATMAATATEEATMATTTTTTEVAAPTTGKQCISYGNTTSAATTVPSAAGHIHAAAATKWLPAATVGFTNRSMTGRGDIKIWE